jgi:hypothetical protein
MGHGIAFSTFDSSLVCCNVCTLTDALDDVSDVVDSARIG